MYQFIDRPLLTLSGEARMVVAAMRVWREAYQAHICPAAALMPLFVGPRACAIGPVHMVMAIMTLDARTTLDMDLTGAPVVSEGEAVLLALWSRIAQGETLGPRDTLAMLLPAHLVDTAMRAFTESVTALSRAGVSLVRLPRSNPPFPPTRKSC